MGWRLDQTLIILILSALCGGDGNTNQLKIEVYNQPSSQDDVPGFLKLVEGSILNLTCEVSNSDDHEVRLSWYLPNNILHPQKRFEQKGQDGSSTLTISHVIEADTGDYECWAESKSSEVAQVKKKIKVLIEPRRGSCQQGQYQCEGEDKQYCIATRYRCDSHPDCPAGDDESTRLCGPEPCKGKIVCPELDFRCIDPTEYCCDPHVSPDTCKFMYPCCESVIEFSIRSRYMQTSDREADKKNDRGSGHTDIHHVYTIVGCSVAFLVVVLALVLAICRLHLLRKSQWGGGRATGAGRPHPPITLHDLDIYFNERNEVNGGDRDYPHVGITYNINHGVQIMGAGPGGPPPYSTHPRRGGRGGARGRGPPPPYMSNENLADPLLNAEDDINGNGDINGNSDMQDNNVRPLEAAAAAPPAPPPVANLTESRSSSPPPRYPGLDSSSDTDTD